MQFFGKLLRNKRVVKTFKSQLSKAGPLKCTTNVMTNLMDYYLTEQQVEELTNFDHKCEDLEDLIEDDQKFNLNEYLKSNIDY